jgi:hypothetical protein
MRIMAVAAIVAGAAIWFISCITLEVCALTLGFSPYSGPPHIMLGICFSVAFLILLSLGISVWVCWTSGEERQ